MTITGQPTASLLDSVLNADTTRTEIGVTLLKKAQDVEQQQGEAMVKMLEKSGIDPAQQRLDTYA